MKYIGIDMSLSSPGIAIYDEYKWYFYFFTKRKREIGINEVTNIYEIKSIENIDYKNREHRIEYITKNIIDIILTFIEDDYIIGIENYAFNSVSQSVTKLAEVGGVLRNKLYNHNLNYCEIPPTSIKKWFTGRGDSNKNHMTLQFHREGIINLWDSCNFPESKNDDVPSPVSDIVDATAVVYYIAKIERQDMNIVGNILGDLNEKY